MPMQRGPQPVPAPTARRLFLPPLTCCILLQLQLLGSANQPLSRLPAPVPRCATGLLLRKPFDGSRHDATLGLATDLKRTPGVGDPQQRGAHPYKHLAASRFLRKTVPIDCLAHMRFIESVFPPYVPQGWPLHLAMVNWRATVDWLRTVVRSTLGRLPYVLCSPTSITGML
ncbi:hypothetical protein N657DRAFT_638421 [Parathielavia appendiculata]|uniref:Secreted protein n=1 Tax=Parathielavia appendiculata TaxID=2587402 RepID=A0AAN6U7W2_9PEZI|nr:hypothetical protein N657DRAFT_638421 [Parathielavia appendiculata]